MFKKKSMFLVSVLLMMAVAITGCGGGSPAPVQNGSGEEGLSGVIAIAGSTSVHPLTEELTMAFMEQNRDVRIDVSGGGSGAGIESAASGAADIGMSSRALRDNETAGVQVVTIANDGIAMIVHPDNPIEGLELTMEQVYDIYTGVITNWSQVGGDDISMTVVSREEGSGTRGAFEEIVLGKDSPTERMTIQNSTGAVMAAVAADVNAIGYTSTGSLNDTIKVVPVNGAMPTVENINNASYPIFRPFIYILPEGEVGPIAEALVDFILSEEGQAIVAREKFIPIN